MIPADPPKSLPGDATFLHPLKAIYADQHLPLPACEPVAGGDLPEPYRRMLAHENDMTPTLERVHAGRIYIQVLRRMQRGEFYLREVILRLEEDDTPVEFGANRVHLDHFPTEARWMILQEKVPLGRILKDHGITHSNRPVGFFRVQADELIAHALGQQMPATLYGRHARISDAAGRPLSEVVEILPLVDPAS